MGSRIRKVKETACITIDVPVDIAMWNSLMNINGKKLQQALEEQGIEMEYESEDDYEEFPSYEYSPCVGGYTDVSSKVEPTIELDWTFESGEHEFKAR